MTVSDNLFVNNTDGRDMLLNSNVPITVFDNIYIGNMLNLTLTNSSDRNIIIDHNYEYINTTISLSDIYNDTIRNGTIILYINKNSYSTVNITSTNLNFKVPLNKLNIGNNNITIKYYSEEHNYQNATTTFNINIKKLNTTTIKKTQ